MKKALKGLFYLLNDLSGAVLKKTRENDHNTIVKLRLVLIFVSVLLALSLALNLYFLLK